MDGQLTAEPKTPGDLTKRYGIVYVSLEFAQRSPKYPALMAGARVLKADIDPATNTIAYTMLHPKFDELGFMRAAPTYRVRRWHPTDTLLGWIAEFEKLGGDVAMRNFRVDADEQEDLWEQPVDRGADYRVASLTK